jgi:GT2 family glycosyltransferase
VGLLDERLFVYFEETGLSLRATRSGWRVGVVLDAEAD